MAPSVHMEWTPAGLENLPQGPSCRLVHLAGVIACKAPLLVFSKDRKEVQGEAKKQGKARGSIVTTEEHGSFLTSAPPTSFMCTHWLGQQWWPLSSPPRLCWVRWWPLLSSQENHWFRVLPRPAFSVWVAPMTSLIWRLAYASCTALAADHLVPVLTSGMRAILSWCVAVSDFVPDPVGCPFRCSLKLPCGLCCTFLLQQKRNNISFLGSILLTWFNFNPSMDKLLHSL